MSKLYRTETPEAIAAAFERNANESKKRSNSATTQKEKRYFDGESSAWRSAANMIRNMEFVGWEAAR